MTNPELTLRIARIEAAVKQQRCDQLDSKLAALNEAIEADDAETAAEIARFVRDALLAAGDGMLNITRAGIEIPDTITAMTLLTTVKSVFDGLRGLLTGEWAQYQQLLRDVPQQAGFPFAIDWPTPPGGVQAGE